VLGCFTNQILTNDLESGLTGTLKVVHEYPLKFEGCLLVCQDAWGEKKRS